MSSLKSFLVKLNGRVQKAQTWWRAWYEWDPWGSHRMQSVQDLRRSKVSQHWSLPCPHACLQPVALVTLQNLCLGSFQKLPWPGQEVTCLILKQKFIRKGNKSMGDTIGSLSSFYLKGIHVSCCDSLTLNVNTLLGSCLCKRHATGSSHCCKPERWMGRTQPFFPPPSLHSFLSLFFLSFPKTVWDSKVRG